MRATILGCGEAFDERLPNTSVLVESGERTLLLDCGYSAAPQVWRAVTDANAVDAVYLSHGHADHYFGLPALLGRWWEEGRTKPLTLMSQPYVLDYIRETLELGYKGLQARYQYPLEYCAVEPGRSVSFGDVTLNFAPTKHAAPNLAVRIDAAGQSVCYSGDGSVTDSSRALMEGAGVVLHEAFWFEPNPVHGDIPTLVEMAERQNIARLAFVHVQRGLRRSPERILELIRQSGGRLALPEPGERFEA